MGKLSLFGLSVLATLPLIITLVLNHRAEVSELRDIRSKVEPVYSAMLTETSKVPSAKYNVITLEQINEMSSEQLGETLSETKGLSDEVFRLLSADVMKQEFELWLPQQPGVNILEGCRIISAKRIDTSKGRDPYSFTFEHNGKIESGVLYYHDMALSTGWYVPDNYAVNMDLATASIVKVDEPLVIPVRYQGIVDVSKPWFGVSYIQLTFGDLVYKPNKSVDWEKVRENRGQRG